MAEVTIRTDDLVSVQDAAKALGVPRLKVYRMMDHDKIIAIVFGGIKFIPTSEIERLKVKGGENMQTENQ
jgi:hypothetical protein